MQAATAQPVTGCCLALPAAVWPGCCHHSAAIACASGAMICVCVRPTTTNVKRPSALHAIKKACAELTTRALQLDLSVFVCSSGNGDLAARRVAEPDIALEDDSRREHHLTIDDELGAADERGHGAERVHRVDEFVPPVQFDVRRHPLARGVELDPEVGGEQVGVGAQRQQVARGLHWCEARARDHDGGRAREAGDGRAHRRLELDDGGGRLVARVDRLRVGDHREGQRAVVRIEERLERDQVHPQVVGVEKLVLGDVLKLSLVLLAALRRLAQKQPARLRVLGQVAALLVRVRALGHLHHERRAQARKVREQLEAHRGTKVVRV
mmetsp:Transcript_17770/g.45476  ORF Transcript_17770/g.45476 Transcript_17770/m.45476 type:complete len:325 (+) Transcript_17770:70-1044(+)